LDRNNRRDLKSKIVGNGFDVTKGAEKGNGEVAVILMEEVGEWLRVGVGVLLSVPVGDLLREGIGLIVEVGVLLLVSLGDTLLDGMGEMAPVRSGLIVAAGNRIRTPSEIRPFVSSTAVNSN
jgi:hypothetical protein